MKPYRRSSDNQTVVCAQYVVFAWCFMIVLIHVGTFDSNALTAAGAILVCTTIALFFHSLWLINAELEAIRSEQDNFTENPQEFTVGDFILRAANGTGSVLSAQEMAEQFELVPEIPLLADGFQSYRSSKKLYAYALSEEDVDTFFPAGSMMSEGLQVSVTKGDVLAMPFPEGGQLFRIHKPTFFRNYSSAASRNLMTRQIQEHIPSQAETYSHWQHKIKATGQIYRKTSKIHARRADTAGTMETFVNGVFEARGRYEKGDYLVVGSRGGKYPMRETDFASRYNVSHPEPASDPVLSKDRFCLYQPTGMVFAHQLSEADISSFFPVRRFLGRWGASICVEPNDFLAIPFPKCGEVYAIASELFAKSYSRHAPRDYVPSEIDSLVHWETVLKQDARVYCDNTTVYAKVALVDGALSLTASNPREQEDSTAVADEEFAADSTREAGIDSGVIPKNFQPKQGSPSPSGEDKGGEDIDDATVAKRQTDASGRSWDILSIGGLCAAQQEDQGMPAAAKQRDTDERLLLEELAAKDQTIAELYETLAAKDAEIARKGD